MSTCSRRLHIFLLLVFLVLPGLSSSAALNPFLRYTPRIWQVEEGLPQNVVQAVVQTRDGYLWVGTQKGLARFDGVHFTIFDKSNVPEMKGQSITTLCEDRDGSLWIGSSDGGIVRYQHGRFVHYGAAQGLVNTYIKVIYQTADGVVWIGAVDGLVRFEKGKFEGIISEGSWKYGAVRSLCADAENTLWIGTDTGLRRLKGGVFSFCPDDSGNVTHAIRAVWCEGTNVWVGTSDLGLVRYTEGSATAFTTADGLSDNMVTTIYSDRQENLWIGTYSGLNRLVNGRFVTELNGERLSFDTVNAVYQDREGDIWIGTKDGLNQLTDQPFHTFTEADGLSRNNIISVLEDSQGDLWIGTWGGGLNQKKGMAITSWGPDNAVDRGAINLILSLCETRHRGLWIGTDYGGGVFQFMDGKFTRYSREQGLVDRPIRVIYEDRDGYLWLGTGTGLVLFKDGKFTRYTTNEGLANDTVRAILEDHAGNLWIGTSDGLSRGSGGKFTNFSTKDGLSRNTIASLYEDHDQNLWVGTVGGGLNVLQDGKFKACTTQQGLFNDDVFSIIEDNLGYFWMSSRYGVSRVSKKEMDDFAEGKIKKITSVSFGRRDGMLSTECNSVGKPAGIRTRDGRLWFPTAKGLAVIDPTLDLNLNSTPPPVVIERVVADKRQIAITDGLRLPPGRGELEFHYSALSFERPEKNRFKYQLEGVDPEWVEAGSRRVAYYNNLYPGHYRFRVKACNNDEVWNETGAVLDFELKPSFWQTRWFIALCSVLVIGAAAAVARYFTRRKLQRKVENLQQQHLLDSERARIAQDMHDRLGASLTEIGLVSEITKRDSADPAAVLHHAGKMSDMVREVADTLDEIVWVVNPENDTLKNFVVYLVHYTEELFDMTLIRCRLDVPMNLPDCSLSADLRHNLFLATQEAFNNIVKHSAATEVWLHLSIEDSSITLSIRDNGRGFSSGSVDPTGNGLGNMKKRLAHVNGRAEITSQSGQGTKITFSVRTES